MCFCELRSESTFVVITVQEFFEEAFVRKRGEVVSGSDLEKDRQRDSPRHPLSRHLRQIPTATQKSLHHLNLRVSQTTQVRSEVYGLERPAHRGIAHRRRKHLVELRRFCFAFTNDDCAANHVSNTLIAR